MSDRPWLQESDPTLRVERDLLKRLNGRQPPSGSVDHGWAALSAEIALLPAASSITASPGGPAPVAPHAAGGAAGLGLAAKFAIGVAVTGGALWTGSALLTPDRPSASVVPPHVSAAAPQVWEAPSAAPAPEPEPEPEAQQPAGSSRPSSASTTLAEEGRLLAKAHQLVQAGQGQQALAVLRDSSTRYPRSVLAQEREVLTIEALGATGAAGPAKQRAQRFLKRFPQSPHAGRLQRFVE